MNYAAKPRTCRRCKGTGEHSFNQVWGTTCMACCGRGKVYPYQPATVMTREQAADAAEYQAGIAAREAREAARRMRREAQARNARDARKAPAEFTTADWS